MNQRLFCLSIVVWVGTQGFDVAAGEWKAWGLQGNPVRSLASADDLICAGTQANGVFCLDLTVARGEWSHLGLDGTPITWLWIDPVQPDVMFAAIGETVSSPALLYRTIDGGSTWEAADGGLTLSPYAVHGVPGSSTVYAAKLGVWRSDDLGDSWNEVSPTGGLLCLEVAPTDPDTIWTGGETVIFQGFTEVSFDGGATWEQVWDSGNIGDNQTADVSAHPFVDGLVLTGHEGFVLRTVDHGNSFHDVLTAPARFFLDWDHKNPNRAYAAGSPNFAQGHVFVSRDLGLRWSLITGILAPRFILRIEADSRRLGVVYAATDDGVYRFYGGGSPLCLDSTLGIDDVRLYPGPCASTSARGGPMLGDAVVGDLQALHLEADRVDLGEVECIIEDGDVALVDVDPPAPPPGEALFLLVRLDGSSDYGAASSDLPRLPSLGGCAP